MPYYETLEKIILFATFCTCPLLVQIINKVLQPGAFKLTGNNVTIFGAEAVKDCLIDFPFGTSAVEDSDRGRLLGFATGICYIFQFVNKFKLEEASHHATNSDLVGIIDFFSPLDNINNPLLQHIIIWKFGAIVFQYIMDSADWGTSLQYR